MYNFSNQVVLVTGGSGQLGEAVVRCFAAAGAHLVVADRAADRLQQLFPELSSDQHYLAPSVDIGDDAALDTLIQNTVKRFGKIDVLVNTVGGYKAGKPLHQTPLEDWDFNMNLNARLIFAVSKAVIPVMLQQRSGRIIHTSARSALSGGANHSAYSASKSAVCRITESMAAEYFSQGIRVNAVLPLALDTSRGREQQPGADYSKWVTPEALTKVIMFLASDDGTPINGALIPV